ncbi:MAG: hypothetical protein HFG80_13355 [Eubacterium sp.]|nr:hypothetical protein [Eubacterium sp.]
MKCAKCGAELKVGCIYCSVCGNEAQIVPDYNLLDDVLTDALTDKSKKKSEKKGQKNLSQKPGQIIQTKKEKRDLSKKGKSSREKDSRKGLIGGIIGIICAAAAICIFLGIRYNSYEYQFQKGEQYLQEKNYEAAISCFRKCIAKEPKATESYLKAADALKGNGNTKLAVSYLENVLDIDPENEDAYEKIVAIYTESDSYDKIIALRDSASEEIQKAVFGDYYIAAPEFEEPEGSYSEDMTVHLQAGSNHEIFYTTDGASPVENGIGYDDEEGIALTEGNTAIQAVCLDDRGIYSDIVTANYEITYEAPDMPVVAPDNGTYLEPQPITVLVPDGCTAYYTWDRSVPTTNSALYTGPIEMPQGNNVLSVVLIDEHGLSSAIFRGNYVYMP